MFDVPHLVKSVRNSLLSGDLVCNGRIVSWSVLRKLVSFEKGVVCAPYHLTDMHLNPDSFQKQNVKLATQVFSGRTVACIRTAVALNCYTESEKVTAEATADMMENINNLMDILNSVRKYDPNPNKCAISDENNLLDKLYKIRDYISSWKRPEQKLDERKTIEPYCFKGLLQTITGIGLLWNDLKQEQDYLITSHVNQDPLENQFSIVRNNRGSYEKNPSAERFACNLSLCIFQNIAPPKTSGYEISDADNLFSMDKPSNKNNSTDIIPEEEEKKTKCTEIIPGEDYGNLLKVENEIYLKTAGNISIPDDNLIYDADDDVDQYFEKSFEESEDCLESTPADNLQKCSVNYLCGFVANRIKKFKCNTCTEFSSLPNQIAESTTEVDENLKLIQLRAYECSKEKNLLYGHLTIPSKIFEGDFTKILSIFETNIFNVISEHEVISKINQICLDKIPNLRFPDCHKLQILKYITTLLLRFTLRKMNQKLKQTKLNKSKLENFKGI